MSLAFSSLHHLLFQSPPALNEEMENPVMIEPRRTYFLILTRPKSEALNRKFTFLHFPADETSQVEK